MTKLLLIDEVGNNINEDYPPDCLIVYSKVVKFYFELFKWKRQSIGVYRWWRKKKKKVRLKKKIPIKRMDEVVREADVDTNR